MDYLIDLQVIIAVFTSFFCLIEIREILLETKVNLQVTTIITVLLALFAILGAIRGEIVWSIVAIVFAIGTDLLTIIYNYFYQKR